MKALKYIRRCAAIHVHDGTVHGGTGEITLPGWTGRVIWGTDEKGWEHVSVSPYDHSITPSWDDMHEIKDMFWWPEEVAIQIHPIKSRYINVMENRLHLWRPKDPAILQCLGEKGREG